MLEDLELFVLIVEKGAMAAAGREMDLAPATVSARLSRLEEHYGTRLLHRTTRSLSPTAEGLALLDGARRVLAEVQELDARVRLGAELLAGSIRISAPVDLGRNWLVPLLDAFVTEHPDVHVDLHLSDGYVDLAGGAYDLALRYGTLDDSSLMMRKLTEVRRVICASPAYLERAGVPERPEDLEQHNCLLMRFGEVPDRQWSFVVDGEETRVIVRGDRTSNDSELVRLWCVAGHGIARKSDVDIAADMAAGRLVPLLHDYEAPRAGIQLVFPGGRPQARRVRLLMEHLVRAPRPGRGESDERAKAR